MPYTSKPSVLTEHLITLANSFAVELGIKKVYYCDQQYIPEVPSLCIEPATVAREMSGVPLRTTNEFLVSLIYYAANVEGVEDAQRAADLGAEAIVDKINADGVPAHLGGTNFGDLVIYGYVNRSEYGYIIKDNKLMRANRMMVYALSKTNLLEA